jgi:hypothetical protein
MARLYSGFLEDTQELWDTREELAMFLKQPATFERYEKGELGRNEQLAYKAIALFEKMDVLIELAYSVAAELLLQYGCLSPRAVDYLDQLKRFDLLRKQSMASVSEELKGLFHYDFCKLSETGFSELPWEFRTQGETLHRFFHTDRHKHFLLEVEALLNSGLHGYATVISTNPKIREYFRVVSK